MSSSAAMTRGVLYVHACPRALTRHVDWAVATILGEHVTLAWRTQPYLAPQMRADVAWAGPVGTAAALIGQLRTWPGLYLEVTEDPTASGPGERFALAPDLGLSRVEIGPHGDGVLTEHRLRTLIEQAAHTTDRLEELIDHALGGPWDAVLEPLRAGIDPMPARTVRVV